LGQLALDNAISRYRTATAGLVHNLPRTVLSLTFYGTVRDYLLPLPGFSSRQTIYGGDLAGTYDLTRGFTLAGSADYSVAREFGGLDKIGMLTASLNYTISPAWSAFGRLNYLERSSRESIAFTNGTLTDVQAGAGLRYTF
jgi:predicted porin